MARIPEDPQASGEVPSPATSARACVATGNRYRNRTILVRDAGFQEDDWSGEFIRWNGGEALPVLPDRAALDVEIGAQPEDIARAFERIALIRIAFPTHMDGRGFSLARHLRLLGYRGRLRARGGIIADQYAMARRCGFDEVEIEPSLARRQSEEQWLFRSNWRDYDYQARLREGPRGYGIPDRS